MTDGDRFGIFGDMRLEGIIEFLLGEGFWTRLHVVGRGVKVRWVVRVKIARTEGITKSEYKETPNAGAYAHFSLMRAAREAACLAYYGEPEISLGVKNEKSR